MARWFIKETLSSTPLSLERAKLLSNREESSSLQGMRIVQSGDAPPWSISCLKYHRLARTRDCLVAVVLLETGS